MMIDWHLRARGRGDSAKSNESTGGLILMEEINVCTVYSSCLLRFESPNIWRYAVEGVSSAVAAVRVQI